MAPLSSSLYNQSFQNYQRNVLNPYSKLLQRMTAKKWQTMPNILSKKRFESTPKQMPYKKYFSPYTVA